MIIDSMTETLRKDLTSGHYGKSGRIPPLRNLAERYSCSPASVKRAVDNLQREGLLFSIHGKGTFLMNGAPRGAHIKRSRVIGMIVLDDPTGREIERQKEKWLDRGWFLAIYNAQADLQAPERENGFLQRAESEGFTAVVMVATPLEPVNAELFLKLRLEGMKIAHLSPYQNDMSSESYFLPDWRSAGQLAVSQAAMRGYRNVVYVKDGFMAPFKKLQADGIGDMCTGLGLRQLPAMDLKSVDLDAVKDCPENTVFLCASSGLGKKVHKKLLQQGLQVPERYGIISLSEDFGGIACEESMITFDSVQQVSEAMEYAVNDKISSLERTQTLFPPSFKEGNSLRSHSPQI